MGFLSRQLDPDEGGSPLGLRPIRSFLGEPGEAVAGGERPEFADASRPGNEPAGLMTGWTRKPKAGAEPKTPEAIQAGYEGLFQ